MTTRAKPKVRNPAQERHALQMDMHTTRVKATTRQGELTGLEAEERQVDADLGAVDIEVMRDVPGAEKRRETLRELGVRHND